MTSKRCEQKTLVGRTGSCCREYRSPAASGCFVTRCVSPGWKHGAEITFPSPATWPEGDPLPGVVECEKCRKAKAAADVEEPPKA